MKKLKDIFRKVTYLLPILYGFILLCGAIFSVTIELASRVIVGIGSVCLMLIGLIRWKNTDFEDEDMLQEYERLFLDQTLSIEEIEAIMIEKYGSRYEPYREEH